MIVQVQISDNINLSYLIEVKKLTSDTTSTVDLEVNLLMDSHSYSFFNISNRSTMNIHEDEYGC
jgi:hypothetical protein